jgi:hypothetical protein
LEIDRARYLSYRELSKFLQEIAAYVTESGPSNSKDDARLTIDTALTEALWRSYENNRGRDDWPEFEDRGHLSVRFRGQAKDYIALRDYRLRAGSSTGSASNKEPTPKPDPRFNDRGPFRRP